MFSSPPVLPKSHPLKRTFFFSFKNKAKQKHKNQEITRNRKTHKTKIKTNMQKTSMTKK